MLWWLYKHYVEVGCLNVAFKHYSFDIFCLPLTSNFLKFFFLKYLK